MKTNSKPLSSLAIILFISCLFLNGNTAFAQCSPETTGKVVGDLVWSNNSTESCGSVSDCYHPVRARIPGGLLRGPLSAHACIVAAKHSARNGLNDDAILWCKASQCHNPQSQNQFDQCRDVVIQWLLENGE